MSLNRIQKTFVKLVLARRSKLGAFPFQGGSRPRKNKNKKKFPQAATVTITNAVTGESTTARAYDDTPIKLKKWLKIRNVRAQFHDMIIKNGSTFAGLVGEDDWKNYPVIVKVGTYSVPYVIDHIGDKMTYLGKTSATVFLRITDNIDYLSTIAEKKKLLKHVPQPVIEKKVKKAKCKKGSR